MSAGEMVDAFILFRYVHYHDVLAQFSLNHWRRPSYLFNQTSLSFKGETLEFRCASASNIVHWPLPLLSDNLDSSRSLTAHIFKPVDQYIGEYIHTEIYLLAEILNTSKTENMDPDHPSDRNAQQKLARLETSLEEAFGKSKKACQDTVGVDESDTSATGSASLDVQRYLFLSACWIYFQRACRHLSGPSAQIDSLLDDVFSMAHHIRRLGVRITPFSLFMIGSEATTEKSRRSVLDLVAQPSGTARSSTGEHSGSPSMNNVDILLSAVWAQDDLHDSSLGYLDYVAKMEWVITARPVLPALV